MWNIYISESFTFIKKKFLHLQFMSGQDVTKPFDNSLNKIFKLRCRQGKQQEIKISASYNIPEITCRLPKNLRPILFCFNLSPNIPRLRRKTWLSVRTMNFVYSNMAPGFPGRSEKKWTESNLAKYIEAILKLSQFLSRFQPSFGVRCTCKPRQQTHLYGFVSPSNSRTFLS